MISNQFYNSNSNSNNNNNNNNTQFSFNMISNGHHQHINKISPPASGIPASTSLYSNNHHHHHHHHQTPIKALSNKLSLIQSPLPLNSFKLGTITHQSSPYINSNKLTLQQLNNNNNNDDDVDEDEDYDKPKVFQVEDSVLQPIQQLIQTTAIVGAVGAAAAATTSSSTAIIANITTKCDSLNISSPNNADTSFLSNHTKSSLKTSISTTSNQTSLSSTTNNKHVKFCTEKNQQQLPPETPIMFSRCSSMTSLNSFDAKSIHSSVASEYSRRPSGIMSPSDLPDSPDETYVMSLRLAQAQKNNCDALKSNEITIIERTILGNLSKINGGGSSNSSEKNSLNNQNFIYTKNNTDEDIPYLKDNTISYDVEGSPWRGHSEVSSLSALTFNDEINDNKIASNKDIAAILSLLQTRSKESKQQQQQQQQQLQQQQKYQQMMNLNTLNFTPPIKLPATTKSNPINNTNTISTTSSINNTTTTFNFYNNEQNSLNSIIPLTSTIPQFINCINTVPTPPPSTASSIPLSIDVPKLYCDEYTPSNLSPQSQISELSVPSLIKQEISQKPQFNNFDALFKRMSFNINHNNKNNNNNNSSNKNDNLEVIDLEVPKVYKNEDNHNNSDDNKSCFVNNENSINRKSNEFHHHHHHHHHFLPQQNSIDTDSPKVFLTEDTPMCYSRSSSLNSLSNNDSNVNRTTINLKTNNNKSTIRFMENDGTLLDNDDLNDKSNSILLSDSCNKPTNTPAFVNMSRASYASQNDTEDEADDEDDNINKNNIKNNNDDDDDDDEDDEDDDEDDDDDEDEDEEYEEDDDSKKENEAVLIKQFINQTMPATINKFKNKIKSTNNSPYINNNNNNNNNNIKKINSNNKHNDNSSKDELLLQNFVNEMLPPVPTRKSTSKVPILNKRLSVNETRCDRSFNEKLTTTTTTVNASTTTVQNKSKKRLSEENPSVHTHKIQQHNRNFSVCYNLATTNNSHIQPHSPKLIKKQSNLTLTKTNSQLNAANLNKARKLGGSNNMIQTASTYSLSTLTTATTTSSITSSSSNSVTASSHHNNNNNNNHHPVVNMTRTSQLRASKVAESKTGVRKNLTTTLSTTTATSSNNTRASTTTKPTSTNQIPQKTKTSTLNIPKLSTNYHQEQQLESVNGVANCINRRKSFHGAPLLKKPLTLASNRCTNENQMITTKQTVKIPSTTATITNSNSTTTTANGTDSTKNILKKTNLNKLNK